MKKILSTTIILGTLISTANAIQITSPIYMPSTGEMVSNINIGYTKSDFDEVTIDGVKDEDQFERSWNFGLNGKYGIDENFSLNYGFDFDFNREMEKQDQSAKLTNVFLGVTSRFINSGAMKFDIIFNVGQQAEKYWTDYDIDQTYVDLGLRYGLDFDSYNVAFTVGSKFVNEYKNDTTQIDEEFNFYFKLENEFLISDNFTMGLDLFYTMNPKNNYFDGTNNQYYKSYNEFGFNIDANYALNKNNYLGVYFAMSENNISQNVVLGGGSVQNYQNLTEYNTGIKLITKF